MALRVGDPEPAPEDFGSDQERRRPGPRPKPAAERLWSRIRILDSGCWEWTGALGRDGYGQFSEIRDGVRHGMYAHTGSYRVFVGPVPDGMHLDHVCHSNSDCPGGNCVHRRCINPAHLEPVTPAENVRRSRGVTALHATATHCKEGHPFDDVNTYYRPTGGRACRECKRASGRRRRAERKVAA